MTDERDRPTEAVVLMQPARDVAPLPPPLPDPTPAPTVTACPNLSAALAAARDRCHGAVKDKRNDFHKYAYASADEVIRVAKEAMEGTGLAILPQLQEMVPVGGGAAAVWALNRTLFLTHSSGEFVPLTVRGWPVVPDRGRPLDKAFAAALTGSLSYLMRDLLQMPRGDEADMNTRDDRGKEAPRPEPAKPQPAPAKPVLSSPATPAAHREAIQGASTVAALRAAFESAYADRGRMTATEMQELTALKDKRKAELGPKAGDSLAPVKAALAQSAPAPAPSDDLPPEWIDSEVLTLLLGKAGVTWEKAREALEEKLDKFLVGVQLEQLDQPDRRVLVKILETMADARKSAAKAKAGLFSGQTQNADALKK